MRNVWAVGDLTGEPMLAHRAMAQGVVVAEIIAGHRRVFDGAVIPAVCFTDPEIVTVGLSPEEARKAGREVLTAQFPFQANGRALSMAAEDGFVRVTARADNHLVLGIAAVGAGVSELAGAFGLALEMGARLEDIGGTIHAHPTLGEAFHEASLQGAGRGAAHLAERHHTPWMTEMFIPRPTLKTMTQRIVSTTMLPSTSVILNSSPASDEIATRATRAGSMPARSNRSAKQTMPMVTSVIGFHFGASTGSLPLTRANTQMMPPRPMRMKDRARGT